MKHFFTLSALSLAIATSAYAAEEQDNKISGQWRTMSIEQNNTDDLTDWHGLATGGKIKIETPRYSNFKFNFAGYLSQDINSNKETIDPLTGKESRYVLGLVNLDDASDDTVAIIGEANVNWHQNSTDITLGRMKLNTPFMNPFDGRMIPNLFSGIWAKQKINDQFSYQAGIITDMYVRGTDQFKSMEDAVGTLGQGKTVDGADSNYAGNISSNGVAVVNVNYAPAKNLKFQIWDYYFDNVFNSVYLQGDHSTQLNKLTFKTGVQYIHQNKVGDGGNSNEALSYVEDGFSSNAYGAKLELQGYGASLMFAATEVTDDGRFTKPREWGKDPLFTFQKRELGDGYGNENAWLVRAKYNFAKLGVNGLKLIVDYSQHNRQSLTGPEKFKYNKYAFGSYNQTNVDVIYNLNHLVKGANIEFLFVNKQDRTNTTNYNFLENKSEMQQYNVIFNWNF